MVEEKVLSQLTLKTAADYKAAIEQCLAEMNRLQEQMGKDRADIERLKAETRVIKAETDAIVARTQARIDAIMTAV